MDYFSEEILVNYAPTETRVAVVENGVLQEIYIERESQRTRVGSIYKGKVLRVLPGMQAAFIEIGLERAAFIHAGDILHHRVDEDLNFVEGDTSEKGNASEKETQLAIQMLLREGQSIVVQVIKDQIGSKGARLTTHLSIPSRYLVLMPFASHIGVSQRIESEEERERLRQEIQGFKETSKVSCGVIVRTAAEGVDAAALQRDFEFLRKLWESIKQRLDTAKPGQMIHEDLPLYLRAVRDWVRPQVERVRIDSVKIYTKVKAFVNQYIPDITPKIESYTAERPVFDLYYIEDEIAKALKREVQLKSGGYLVVDQTEAMTTVDVNTGAYVGARNLEETIFKTNLEAAHAIARQLRLRNLGGIIIIDFIDMQDAEHVRQVMRNFEKALERDNVRTKITRISELGLIEMTRKRTRESLQRSLCEPCSVCQGRGFIKTAQTVCYEIYREILREAKIYNAATYLVIASQSVVERLLDEESANVADLAEFLNKTIQFQVETLYSQEQFDVVPV